MSRYVRQVENVAVSSPHPGWGPQQKAPTMIKAASASLVALALLFGACGTSEPVDETVPEADGELVAEGEVLYRAACAECHGSDLRGTDKGPSHLSVVYEPGHHGDAAFALAVINGVRQHHWRFGDMAPVPGLEDADIERIVAYVRENQRIYGFEPYPP